MNLEKLKHLRENKGLTQKQLAEDVGISHSTIQELENAKRTPSLQSVLRLAEHFGISVEELLGGEKQRREVNLKRLKTLCQKHWGNKIKSNAVFDETLKTIVGFINAGKA